MTFRGRGSSACLRCRTKRTKCDKKTPSCTQCLRTGSICTGYRDHVSLAFRDETGKLYNSGSVMSRRKNPPKRSQLVDSPAPRRDNDLVVAQSPWAKSPSPVVEDLAINFFFHHYVHRDPGNMKTPHSQYDYIPAILDPQSPDCPLLHSILCLGKAGLAKLAGTYDAQASVETEYSTALRLTNQALKNEEDAKSDKLLVAVMLLGHYEVSTNMRIESLQSWAKHINGLSALIRLRGREQFKTLMGQKLFAHARVSIIMNCFFLREQTPDIIAEGLPPNVVFLNRETELLNMMATIVVRFCNTRAALTRIDAPIKYILDQEPTNVISELFSIDSALTSVAAQLPEQYWPEIVPVEEPSSVIFSDFYHSYNSTYFSTIWNHYRTVRLLINNMLRPRLRFLSSLQSSIVVPGFLDSPSDEPPNYQEMLLRCETNINQLSEDICASVPFHLGTEDTILPSISFNSNPIRASCGYVLIWPLYVTGLLAEPDHPRRNWVTQSLERISTLTGIEQGAVLARLLRNEAEDIDNI